MRQQFTRPVGLQPADLNGQGNKVLHGTRVHGSTSTDYHGRHLWLLPIDTEA